MIVSIIIVVVFIAFCVVCREYITATVCDLLSRFFPWLHIEEVICSPAIRKGWFVFFIVLFTLFVVWCIVNAIMNRRYEKAEKEYMEEQQKLGLDFLEEYSLDKGVFSEILGQIKGLELLPEPVEENHYRYRGNTDSQSQWGVYVGRYFLRCGYTLQVIRLAKLLRANGVEVKKDLACGFDRE